MGCSTSKLEETEPAQVCKDRTNFIKQAIDQRLRFASGHMAYIQTIRRVSIALCNYMEDDEHRSLLANACSISTFGLTKEIHPGNNNIPLKSFSSSKSTRYAKADRNSFITVEQSPRSLETTRTECCDLTEHFGVDGLFTVQISPSKSTQFPLPYNNPYPPPSPQYPVWDSFWNPFSTFDAEWYSSRCSVSHGAADDLMEDVEQYDDINGIHDREEKHQNIAGRSEEPNIVLNLAQEIDSCDLPEVSKETDIVQHVKECRTVGAEDVVMSQTQNAVQKFYGNKEATEGTPSSNIDLKITITSLTEAIRNIDNQFVIICDCADEVSEILEVHRSRKLSTSKDLTVLRILNPIALIRSASSSKFPHASTSPRDGKNEKHGVQSEEIGSSKTSNHLTTLDRLYAWEKKLYDEVKYEESIRISYEKKCKELERQDITGADPTVVDKTNRAIRDLRTKLRVSIHSIEAISKRIEVLRDEELHPQLKVSIQGLAQIWKTMANCHQIQKHIIDQAKLLLATATSSSPRPPPPHLAQYATILERELRRWRSRFTKWIRSQRLYAQALAGWVRRCSPQPELPRDATARAVVETCIQWSRLLESVDESAVVHGLELFAAGVGSVVAKLREREEAARKRRAVEVEEREEEEEGKGRDSVVAENAREFADEVALAGMDVAIGALAEFSASISDGMSNLHGCIL